MDVDCKRRMGVWGLLLAAGLSLVLMIGRVLFFDPGHGGGPLDKGNTATPAPVSQPRAVP